MNEIKQRRTSALLGGQSVQVEKKETSKTGTSGGRKFRILSSMKKGISKITRPVGNAFANTKARFSKSSQTQRDNLGKSHQVQNETLKPGTDTSKPKVPASFQELPGNMTLKQTNETLSKFKQGEFGLRKSSDNKSLVVAWKSPQGPKQSKFSPGKAPGTFVVQGRELSFKQIIERYGGADKYRPLQSTEQAVSPQPPNGPEAKQPEDTKFEGLSTEDANKLLADKPVDTCLLRTSQSRPGCLVISEKNAKGQISHTLCEPVEEGKFAVGVASLSEQEIIKH